MFAIQTDVAKLDQNRFVCMSYVLTLSLRRGLVCSGSFWNRRTPAAIAPYDSNAIRTRSYWHGADEGFAWSLLWVLDNTVSGRVFLAKTTHGPRHVTVFDFSAILHIVAVQGEAHVRKVQLPLHRFDQSTGRRYCRCWEYGRHREGAGGQDDNADIHVLPRLI